MPLPPRLEGPGSIAGRGLVEPADITPRNGVLAGVLMQFVRAMQDAKQREADRLHAEYQELTREIK